MHTNFEVINNLPILPLYNELEEMIAHKKIKWSDHFQICINSIPEHTDNYFFGCGSLEYDWDKQYKLQDGTLHVPKRENPPTEEDFTELCDVFKNTLFEEVYNSLKSKYKLGRVRLMKSEPKTCLTWHRDANPRLHFPLKTQDGCFMVIEDEVKHLLPEEWCLTRTTKLHTAFNGSREVRIHLVAAIVD